MENKSKTGLYIGIAAIVVIVAVVIGIIAMNGGNNSGNTGSTGGTETEQTEPEQTETEEVATEVTAEELMNPEMIVDYGDYETMELMAKDIQNGAMTGQIIQIDGIVSHPGVKYSVVEESDDGTSRIGTEFVIVGADESEYPADGSHVIITGKVVEQEPMYFVIQTLSEYVEVMDEE